MNTGIYNVTITDANNCTFNTSVTITQPTAALSATSLQANVSCFGGNNGSIDLTVTGGTAPYIFSWNNTASSEDISGLTAGIYSVTITDANGCTLNRSVTISEPASAISLSSSSVINVACYNQNTGETLLNPSGGTSPYTYLWSNSSTSQNLSNVSAESKKPIFPIVF